MFESEIIYLGGTFMMILKHSTLLIDGLVIDGMIAQNT